MPLIDIALLENKERRRYRQAPRLVSCYSPVLHMTFFLSYTSANHVLHLIANKKGSSLACIELIF